MVPEASRTRPIPIGVYGSWTTYRFRSNVSSPRSRNDRGMTLTARFTLSVCDQSLEDDTTHSLKPAKV